MMNSQTETRVRHGTAAFRRTNLAMFAGGLATFGLLYCVQPLMPEFSAQFQVSAAESALSLSLTSAVVAVTMLFAGPLSDAWGRKKIMTVSLFASAVLMLLAAVAPNWSSFLVLRALLGLSLGGLPAVGMTYLSEEVHPESIGLGMGLYIGGNAAGGLGGRLLAGVLTDYFGWRVGLGAVGAIGALAAVVFVRCLPPSRGFVRQPLHLGDSVNRFRQLFGDPGMPWLFAVGSVLLGGFVTVYNYIGYRLMAPPYALSQSVVGLIFSVYIVGMFSSSWIGHLAGRLGRRKVLWTMFALELAGLALTLTTAVWSIVLGIAVITFGFFGGHSIASSWVGRRAGVAKAQAAALYLFAYYLGAGIAGAVGGLFYARSGWHGVAAFVAVLFALGLVFAWRLYHVQPLKQAQDPARELPLP
jgi:MFS transporter, YNFM family, putative membrane transport protein